MAEILVVDDQPDLRTVMRIALERDGHGVLESSTGREAVQHLDRNHVDLVLLDIGLPDRSGLDLLTDLQARCGLPIIFVSGRSAETDRVLGLRMGADDYISKPFSVHELTARVAATLRRTARVASTAMQFGELEIRPLERKVTLAGRPVETTSRELDLLIHLARHPLRVFGRDELLTEVWRSKSDWQDPATVTEHIRRLRKKLESDPAAPRWIETVRGAGYRFVP